MIMQAKMRFTYLGMEDFQGKKNPEKTYYQVSLLQGSEVAKVFLEQGQEVLFDQVQKFDELDCNVMFSLATDKYGAKIQYRLVNFEPSEVELPEKLFDNEKLKNLKDKATA